MQQSGRVWPIEGCTSATDAQDTQEHADGMVLDALASLRLYDLPTDLLKSVSHTAGRSSRSLSKPIKVAYGPLTCGLALHTSKDLEAVTRMLAHDPQRFFDISSLELGTYRSSFMDSMAGAFPKLQSLTLQHPFHSEILAALAPLGPCLTSLRMSAPDRAEHDLMSDMQLLTCLRKLVLVLPDKGDTERWVGDIPCLHHLSRLSGLQHFEVRAHVEARQNCLTDASWLTSLANLQLTTLKLQPFIWDWNQSASSALERLSTLQSLQLDLDLEEAVHFVGAAQAIAGLTALTSLQMGLAPLFPDVNVQSWAGLHLSSLTLSVYLEDSRYVLRVLEAMAVQKTLTCLQISPPLHANSAYDAGAALYGASLGSLGSLSRLKALHLRCCLESAPKFFETVAQLTRLTSLVLRDPRPGSSMITAADLQDSGILGVTLLDPRLEGDWPAVVAPLSSLRELRELELRGLRCDGLPKALLHCLPCFPCLRELSLSGGGAQDPTPGGARVTGEDLQQLGVLQGTLTALKLSDIMGVDGPCVAAASQLPWLRGARM